MAGFESRTMTGRGPDGTLQVVEVDADGQFTGISEINTNVNTVLAGVSNLIDGVREDYGHVIPPVGALMQYGFVGLSLISVANPNRALTWRVYRIAKATGVILNGDSGAAHAPATWVRIGNTSGFQAGDIVWLVDDNTPNGELGTINTITANNHLVLTGALGQNFTLAQNAYVYLARRGGLTNNDYRCTWGKYRAAGANNMRRIYFHAPRTFAAGDGLVIEAYDLANVAAPGQIAVTAYYDDRH